MRFCLRFGRCMLAVAMLSAMPVGMEGIRPPAVPLVAADPYFSIWSSDDQLDGRGHNALDR